LDSSIQWGETYQYVVTVVTMVSLAQIAPPAAGRASGQNGEQNAGENAGQGSRENPAGANPAQLVEVEGDDSAPVTVMPKDTFPPAVPTGVEAVFSGPGQQPFIDLIWNPSPESDLAGYNVYRSSGGQPATRINSSLILTPAFRDSNVQPGTTYQYSITSVDVRGNESARSEVASESVP
jgi:fibronectin type 3 domain-containing protein